MNAKINIPANQRILRRALERYEEAVEMLTRLTYEKDNAELLKDWDIIHEEYRQARVSLAKLVGVTGRIR